LHYLHGRVDIELITSEAVEGKRLKSQSKQAWLGQVTVLRPEVN